MYAQAFGLQEATKDAIYNEGVMTAAAQLLNDHHTMGDEEFVEALFHYSAFLSAVTATLTTEKLLTEDQLNSLLEAVEEISAIDSEITD